MQGGAYDFKADIFSLGVVLWELITRVDAATYARTTGQTYAIDLQRLASITPEDTPLGTVFSFYLQTNCCFVTTLFRIGGNRQTVH